MSVLIRGGAATARQLIHKVSLSAQHMLTHIDLCLNFSHSLCFYLFLRVLCAGRCSAAASATPESAGVPIQGSAAEIRRGHTTVQGLGQLQQRCASRPKIR